MDIKERFYANLDVIREQMGSPHVSARPVMNRPTPIRPSGPPTRPVMNRPMDNKSFVDRSSSPQDVAQKAKQKASSFGGLNWQERSALGVDMQEAEQQKEQLDEKAKWRKTKVATKVTDPEGYDSASYDYHKSNPRSTGMMKATSDKPYKKGSLMTRGKPKIKKGKITKGSAERLKDRIKANLNMIREDYGKRDSDDAKELENIASGKVSRKSDKKIQKMFKRDAAKLRKKAVTGMDEQAEQLDEISGSRLGNYLVKNTKQRKKIQAKFNAGKASRDEFRKGLRRVEGSKNAIKKLTGQAKVPAK